MGHFLSTTEIERSYPAVQGGKRRDQLAEAKHYEHLRQDFQPCHGVRATALRHGPPYYRMHLGPHNLLPCCLGLAAAHAKGGRPDAAEAILARVEATAGELGLLAEEMDARTGAFLGNTPLLFSHAEYLKAVIETAKARPFGRIGLMAGMALREAKRWLGGG